jgi:hypothetical protein
VRELAAAVVAMVGAAASPAATLTARASAESFSIGEPIIIEMTFGGITRLINYGVEADPAGKNPPMGLFNSSEAGFGFPIGRTNPDLPFRHDVLVNKWVTFDAPGSYRVTIDGMIGIPGDSASGRRFVRTVAVTVTERNEPRLQEACRQWSDIANVPPVAVPLPEDTTQLEPVDLYARSLAPRRLAQQVLMYLQDEALIPCLLKSASRHNLAPAITLREIDSVASVQALRELVNSPIPEVSREARNRLIQMIERTKKPEIRAAAAAVLGLPPPG